ncbi:hypothetical protein WL26_22890 [Burkholderia cepacia]|nr:hypothetical protein WL26_22890 [Burkholderia cepacia]
MCLEASDCCRSRRLKRSGWRVELPGIGQFRRAQRFGLLPQQGLQPSERGHVELSALGTALQAIECGLAGLVELFAVTSVFQRGQAVGQPLQQLPHQPSLRQVAGGARFRVAGFPVTFDHAGQYAGGLGPAAPAACACASSQQMPGDAQVLALAAQVMLCGFIDVGPIDGRLLQAAELDHFVVDALVSIVFFIEHAGRLARIERRQQGIEVQRGGQFHQ